MTLPIKTIHEETKPSIIALSIVFILGLFAFFLLYSKRLRSPLLFKSELAKKYGVSKKTLNKWIELFFEAEIAKKLFKQKRIRLYDVEKTFGKADIISLYSGNPVVSKSDIQKKLKISATTLKRLLSKSENLKKDISLSLEQYKKLNTFPPIYVQQILAFCEKISLETENSTDSIFDKIQKTKF